MVLLIYFAATRGIGLYFYKKSRALEGFTAADRRAPGWAVGLSISGTITIIVIGGLIGFIKGRLSQPELDKHHGQ